MAGLPELYCTLWTAELNRSLAARNETKLAVMVLQTTSVERIVVQKGAERTVRTFGNLEMPPFWLLRLSNAGFCIGRRRYPQTFICNYPTRACIASPLT